MKKIFDALRETALKTLSLAVFISLLAACASSNFYPYESRDNVYNGKGGSRFVTDGIDVWFNGEPPRKYSILGYIEDRRSGGVDERHQSISSDVLKKAKEVGASGLIESVTSTQTSGGITTGGMIGTGGGGFGMGIGIGMPSERSTIKYTVVKYLD